MELESSTKTNGARRNVKQTAVAAVAAKFDAKAFLSSVGAGRTPVKYAKKKTVFKQGHSADAVFYIQKGKIQLNVVSKHGKRAVVGLLGAGDFLGEGCLAGQPLHMASAFTLSDSTVFKIDKETMIAVLLAEPEMSEMFIAFLLSRNIQFEADLVDQLFNSSERRLARVLLLLANFGNAGKLEDVVPMVSQDLLAAKVGTTRSRINFFMNKFRRLGLIEYGSGPGGLKVHSGLLNVIIHD